MADGPSSTIVFDGNSTGAVAALHAVDVAAKNTAQAVQGTGAAMSKIGDGADAGVDKAVNATKRFEAQLKRLNLELESGGRNTAAYIEGRAKMAGADTTALAPLLAQYDQIKAKQALANAEFVKSGKVMTDYGMGVKATSAALRQVPAQFTDIIVSLQGGQAPLTVLLQQGGQLKDVFGGVGNAFKALSGYVMGLINPVTLAIGAVATLGAAYYKGAAEAEAYNKALITTGNAAGVTAGQLSGMAKAVAQATGGTIGAAAEALANIAGTAGIATGQFERVSAVAVQMQKLTGVAVSETVKQFAELGKEPVKASEKLNETTHYLTAAVYEQIKALEDQGRTLEAGALAQTAYASAMESRIPALTENLGYVQRAWNGITGAAKGAWDAMLNVGRPTADVDVIGALKAKIADTQKNLAYNPKLYGADLKNMQAELVVLERMAASKGAMAAYDADRIKRDEASIKLSKEAEKYASNEVKMAREIAKANADFASSNKSDKDIENYGARLRGIANAYKDIGTAAKAAKAYQVPEYDKLIAAMDKANTQAQQEIATGEALSKSEKYRIDTLYGLVAAYNAKKISATQLAAAEVYLDKVTREMASAEQSIAESKALAEAQKAIAKARTDAIQSHAKEIESLNEKAQKLEDEVAMYGMSKEAIEELTTARMLDQIEVLRGFDNSTEEIARIEKTIAARKRLAAAGTALDLKDAGAKYAKDLAAENKKAAEASEKYWEDALMRAFESGKGFFQSLWDTIKNTLKTQVLKVTVQGVMGTLGLGAAGAAAAGTGGGTDVLGLANMASSVSNAYNGISGLMTIGSQTLAGTMSVANALGTIAANATGTGITGLLATNGAYGTAAAGSASAAAGSMTSAMAAIPGWGWAAMAAVAVAGILKGHGETRSGATYDTGADGLARYQQGPSGGEIAGDTARAMFNATKTSIQDTLKLVGSSATVTGYTAGLESSGKGKGFAFAGGFVDGKSFGDSDGREGHVSGQWAYQTMNPEQAMAAYVNELQKSTLEALQAATDVPKIISDQLAGVNINALDQAGLDTLVNAVSGTINAVNGLVWQLNTSGIAELHDLGFAAAAGLIQFSGGLENLTTNLDTYYTNFYSAEEQRAQTIKNINATVGNGFDAAATDAKEFRTIVEAAMLDTSESGLALTAKLLGVSGAMGTLTKESEAAAEAVRKESEAAAEALKKALADLFGSLDDAVSAALSAVEAAVSAERDALSAAYDTQAQQISDSIDTVSASVGKLQSLADSLKSTLDGMRISGSDAQYRAAAQSQISAALATARAGGGLPLDGQLTSALATVSKPSEQLFATFEDYARDFYSTANDISALGDLTNDQLSLEQATLAALETQSAILEASYKAQLSILDATLANAQEMAGKDSGLLTLAEALNALVNALSQKTYFEANPDVANAYAKNDYGLSAGEYATVHYGLYGKNEGRTSPNGAPADTAKSYFDLYPDVAAAFKANSYGMDQIAYSARHFANFGKAEGRVFPGFAVGTNYVPQDMIAQIHEGEAIVPKAYNPAAGGQNNAELVAEIRALRQEVASLKASNEATAKATSKFASQFETASEGGRALLTEVYA